MTLQDEATGDTTTRHDDGKGPNGDGRHDDGDVRHNDVKLGRT
jgi:hypothetical protein